MKLARALELVEADASFAEGHPLVSAKIWAATGRREKAEAALKSMSSSTVSESEFLLVSAMVARAKGDAEEAVSLVEKVLSMNGSNFEALVLRGKVAFERDSSGGLADFLRAAKGPYICEVCKFL